MSDRIWITKNLFFAKNDEIWECFDIMKLYKIEIKDNGMIDLLDRIIKIDEGRCTIRDAELHDKLIELIIIGLIGMV